MTVKSTKHTKHWADGAKKRVNNKATTQGVLITEPNVGLAPQNTQKPGVER
jgi:hypothetical protein